MHECIVKMNIFSIKMSISFLLLKWSLLLLCGDVERNPGPKKKFAKFAERFQKPRELPVEFNFSHGASSIEIHQDHDSVNTSIPSVNIKTDDDGFTVEMVAPGFNKADFKIDLKDNKLTISSEKENTKQDLSIVQIVYNEELQAIRLRSQQ